MNNPNKKRLRRTMMFLNAQKPGLIKDPYIYKADSLMLDLEDAVAENQKDVARFSLYHALKTVDYRGAERVVRINGLDTPYWREDIRACVAGGCDSIRIPKTEHAEDASQLGSSSATFLTCLCFLGGVLFLCKKTFYIFLCPNQFLPLVPRLAVVRVSSSYWSTSLPKTALPAVMVRRAVLVDKLYNSSRIEISS